MKNIIEENRQYILSKQIYNRNYYLDKFANFVNTKNVLVVEGQRRVGKSSVVISFLKSNNIDLNKVFYINKELDILNNIKNAVDLDEVFSFF
ncbi:ATPase AAA family, partial [Candidatus Vampirococcus lugosii]|nr:ATPase AAA family [Candidatus Vampirococcus lugosii]